MDANLTTCDVEPIHIPGAIQPHGMLIGFEPQTFEIIQIAGDTQRYLGQPCERLIGQRLQAHIGAATQAQLETQLAKAEGLTRPFLVFEATIQDKPCDATIRWRDGLLVAELEPQIVTASDPLDLVQAMIGQLQAANGLEGALRALASEIQTVTGFDRVMIYRFEEDKSGHVVAECRALNDVESFLDLHYPASDIPVQARELYRKNWLRYIPDATYTPHPLIPLNNPRTRAPLDLSFSRLRSVSPVHLEYLANMGVRASMSLSIVVGGELWGLIACHSHAPLYLGSRLRLALEVFAQLASLHLRSTLELGEANERVRIRDIHNQLNHAMSRDGLAGGLIEARPNLLDYIPASGVVVRFDGRNHALGTTPTDAQVGALAHWLNEQQSEGVFATTHLADVYPAARAFLDRGAGLLALSVSRQPRDYVMWFLPEVVRTVKWAGDPNKPVTSGPLGERLSPRKSFAAWTETRREQSRPWCKVECDAANLLRTSVLEVVLRRVDEAAREREKTWSRQDLLMNELDHRVKNTIATIQALVRLSSRSADSLVDFTDSIEKRLMSMAKAHSLLSVSHWHNASLRTLVEEEVASQKSKTGDNIRLTGVDYALEPQTAISLALVLHELTTNALKHGSLSAAGGTLAVGWERIKVSPEDLLVLSWTEDGGPPVKAPARQGFGRSLIEHVFANDVGGHVSLKFDPAGVSCVIEIPFSKIVGEPDDHVPNIQSATMRDAVPALVAGLRIFVVEDNAMIAHYVEQLLEDDGAIVVGPFASLGDGLAAAAYQRFDVALLDINLDGEAVWPLATVIYGRGIPIVLATGYSDAMSRPNHFAELPVVAKPYDAADLLRQIAAAARA
jgi:chemotaxis family two-component system sensor kinase Cph1